MEYTRKGGCRGGGRTFSRCPEREPGVLLRQRAPPEHQVSTPAHTNHQLIELIELIELKM